VCYEATINSGKAKQLDVINRLIENFWLTGLSISRTETSNMATALSVKKNLLLCSKKGSAQFISRLSFEYIESLKHISKVETKRSNRNFY